MNVVCIGVRRRGEIIRVTSRPPPTHTQPSSVKMWCKCVQNSPEYTKIHVNLQNCLDGMPPKALKMTLFALSALTYLYHRHLVWLTYLFRSPAFFKGF